jgi:hypothetical protein
MRREEDYAERICNGEVMVDQCEDAVWSLDWLKLVTGGTKMNDEVGLTLSSVLGRRKVRGDFPGLFGLRILAGKPRVTRLISETPRYCMKYPLHLEEKRI